MGNPFKAVKNLINLIKASNDLQKKFSQIEITTETEGVVVKIRGDQKIQDIIVDGVSEPRIVKAVNKAIEDLQLAVGNIIVQAYQEENK